MPIASTLPSDILFLICGHLGTAHPQSLSRFALVCKAWGSVAAVEIHRTVSFRVRDQQSLKSDVEAFRAVLERRSSSKYVHRLEITGLERIVHASDDSHVRSAWRFAPNLDLELSCYDVDAGASARPDVDSMFYGREIWDEQIWQPLASLTADLPALSDLIWSCHHMMPLCVLDAIQRALPHCRLWVNDFKLQTILQSPVLADAEECLITSPSLHAVRAQCLIGSYEEDALMRVVGDLAPNIKQVSFVSRYPGAEPPGPRLPPWPGFQTSEPLPPPRKGALTSLQLYQTDGDILQTWSDYTDLEALEHLSFSTSPPEGYLDVLSHYRLEHLQSLELQIRDVDDPYDPWLGIIEQVLLALPPLTALTLERQLHLLRLQEVLSHHGQSLRRLWLLQSDDLLEHPQTPDERQFDTSNIIEMLPQSCPNLEQLTIPVRRTRGDKREIDAYRSIGRLSKLHTLDITLDCSDYSVLWGYEEPQTLVYFVTPCDETWDDFKKDAFPEVFIDDFIVRNGHIYDAFWNAALDEKIVKSIFKCISGNRTRLEKLTMRTRGGAVFSPYGRVPDSVERVVNEVSREWVLERNVRDNRRNELSAKDITKRFDTRKFDGFAPGNRGEEVQLEGPTEEIFRMPWPKIEGGDGDWTREWCSFPLEGSDV